MTFRYYDRDGRQLSPAQLKALDLSTPEMEHVFASVVWRLQPPGSRLESPAKTPGAVEG